MAKTPFHQYEEDEFNRVKARLALLESGLTPAPYSIEHIVLGVEITIPLYSQMIVMNQIRIEGTLKLIGTLVLE